MRLLEHVRIGITIGGVKHYDLLVKNVLGWYMLRKRPLKTKNTRKETAAHNARGANVERRLDVDGLVSEIVQHSEWIVYLPLTHDRQSLCFCR